MTPATRRLRIGMVGVGGFGSYRRARLREADRFDLLVCCDRNPEALAKACEEENAQGVSDFDALLADDRLEAVVVSTGIDTHARFALAAMRAGKHVLIEKPLCGTVQEMHELRQTRNATGRIVGMGHHDNHVDVFVRIIREFIDAGRLGTVVAYEENSSHSGGLEIKPGEWRGLADRNPGGMLMQCGVHALHRLNHLFGPVQSVSAMMRYDAHPDTQTADAANVLLRHASGLIGTLNCYHVTAYVHELRIFGTRGNLYLDTYTHQAWFQERKRYETETRQPVDVPKPGELDGCSNLIQWHRAIVEGGSARPSLEEGIAAVAPVFAADQSAREGREVAVTLA